MMTAGLLALTLLACPEPPPITLTPITAPTPSQRAADVQREVDILAKSERFTGRQTGYAGTKSDTYKSFERLLEVAEDADLEGLLSDRSPIVRIYAYWGLLRRGHDPSVLQARLPGQSERVGVQYGCLGTTDTVGEVVRGLSGR